MDPATIALIGSLISAGGAIGGGILGKGKESKLDKQKRSLIDDLMASIKGSGPYTNLFKADEDTFHKSFVEPAKSRFRNQIAPQIQQQYIESGQQNGSGLEDTLSRAGVDLDQLLNEHYANFQQNAQNRQGNAITSILGQSPLSQNQSTGSAAKEGFSGYLSSSGFGDDISGILNGYNNKPKIQSESIKDTYKKPRKGFENEQYYNPYTGEMG